MSEISQTAEQVLVRLNFSDLHDELSGNAPHIDLRMLREAYLPAASLILMKYGEAQKRILIAVSGPPGSGKSTFVMILSKVLTILAPEVKNAVIGMDGWHYPNAILEQRCFERDGKELPLRAIKGAPQTFDSAAFVTFVSQLHQEENLSYPIYSRKTHEPRQNAASITASDRIILLEGNYLLLDETPWSELQNLFDLRFFLRAKRAELLPGLIARKAAGGSTLEDAARHVQQVDLPNIDLVLRHSLPADLTLDLEQYRAC